jgi:uncharacterized membrane protein YeaQ/YmgE (transglycosylase-associated protein family)
MTHITDNRPLDKLVAVFAAIPLIAAETGLNAEHIAHSEGWASTLVIGIVGATLAAAVALPIAERAWMKGYRFKAFGLSVFFALMLVASFSTSVGRVGSAADGAAASAQGHNGKLGLAKEAYAAAQASQEAECKTGRGPRCRAAEDAVTKARNELVSAPAAVAENSMAKRLSAATGLSIDTVALYQPLLFPLALQIGGFFFLAYGFAPAAMKAPVIDVTPVIVEAPAPMIEKAPAKRVRKVKPKAITYQPMIEAKLDGRKTAGMKRKAANLNTANANDA